MGSTQIEQPQDGMPEIPGYRLLRILGHGGMSTVYLGQQLSLGREVAIKVMRQEVLTDETGRRRFENEARTIARLDHPHIVHIHEVGRTAEGQPYHVMPVFPRGHLGKRNLTRDESRVREILEALLSALAYAHSRGIVHRDVKAENVLFDEAERPMLTDFGIALRRGYGSRVTTAGVAVGSTAYMAPEQARGTEVDLRADLYSLGVLAWEMLTGSLPYKAQDGLSMALKHVQDPIPRLPVHLAHWQRFFDRALAKSPIERFNDAQEMLNGMRRVPHAQKQPLRAALARARSRTGPKQIAIAAIAATVVIGGIALLVQMDRRNTERALANYTGGMSGGTPLPANAGLDPTLGAPVPDPTDAMLRAAPESAAQRFISDAERQIRQRKLTSPAGDNAYESVMTAWRTDSSHIGLAAVSDRLFDALGTETERRLRNGDDAVVRDLLSRMTRLAEQDGARGSARMAQTRKRLIAALSSRMDEAQKSLDRAAAQRVVASARSLGLSGAPLANLQARATKIAQPGDRVADTLGDMTLVQAGGKLVAVSRSSVSRDDYAAFAKATGRPASLCREKASLLRVLAPRDWQTPGFEQSGNGAVVCISWQDAEAYARWQSQRSKYRYRLPTAAEAQAASRSDSGKAVAEWLNDCAGGSCARRMTAGRSWRGAGGGRPLDASRGYDDVGFRLVREM
ncbi:MAG: bifunctional serine/threonine-protein kinase/formylglycine-generating enzyme family protein [Pseudomonadota bacterium]